jgi:hypothetical protein
VTGEGLCHGPGCTRVQTVPYWCSDVCQDRWNRGCAADCGCGACRQEQSLLDMARQMAAARAGLARTRWQLEQVDLSPFQEAITRAVASIAELARGEQS